MNRLNMKKQVVVIHGGDTWTSYKQYIANLKLAKLDLGRVFKKGWKTTLQTKLGNRYDVVAPRMPNSMNAKYLEWKIWFDKHISHLNREVILIGHSLGGIFLAKYLSENRFPKKIRGLFLVAPPYESHNPKTPLADFIMPKNVKRLEAISDKVYLYHSTDDKMVPTPEFSPFLKVLPNAKFRIFKNRGHFIGATFPELVRDIKVLYR